MNILKNNLYNIIRNYLKKYFTGNLGQVIEEDDRLVCYVKKGKCKRDKYSYTISCFGIMEKDKKLAKTYKLDKPICYIIDGLESEGKNVDIYGYSDNNESKCEVIVRNCKFSWDAYIHVNGKCTLETTYIRSFASLWISAEDLTIANMNLDHKMKLVGNKYHILISAKNSLNICWSNIGEICDMVKVDLMSDNLLNIYNARIMGNEVNIKSPTIETEPSETTSIISLKHVNIETNEFDRLNIDSPMTIFNGKDISECGKKIELEKNGNPLTNKKLELLDKNIENNCSKNIDEMSENFKSNLNNQSVSKVLKK